MPPGSLSTLAVIKPGPRTARNATILALASANMDLLRGAVGCMKADGSFYFRLVVFPLNEFEREKLKQTTKLMGGGSSGIGSELLRILTDPVEHSSIPKL